MPSPRLPKTAPVLHDLMKPLPAGPLPANATETAASLQQSLPGPEGYALWFGAADMPLLAAFATHSPSSSWPVSTTTPMELPNCENAGQTSDCTEKSPLTCQNQRIF
jgi:hypothetical protein